MSFIQRKYSRDGLLKNWDSIAREPDYARVFYEIMIKNGLLPDDLSGFVFLSPSSNKASKEIELAKLIDDKLTDTRLAKKPLFIASDFFGARTTSGKFKAGFDSKKLPNFKNIEFSFLSADANELPVKDSSVNIIMDKLGAVWHAITSSLSREGKSIAEIDDEERFKAEKAVLQILSHYASKLKKDGHIVLDAPSSEGGGVFGTGDMLLVILGGKIDEKLREIGLSYKFVGENQNRFLVLGLNEETKE